MVMLFVNKYYSGDQMKNNEMEETCYMYGRQVRCIQGLGGLA